MTPTEFRKWLLAQLETIEPRIGEPPSAEWAAVVAEAKQHCYGLGFHEFVLSLPDSDTVKTPLTAANQLRRCLAQIEKPQTIDLPSDGLLNLEQAAAYLGYKPEGLRKIVKLRQIEFAQNGRGPIRFRREWLDEFVARNAGGPDDIERSPAQRPPTPLPLPPAAFGFDPSLIRG
jgi:hypothetical protein